MIGWKYFTINEMFRSNVAYTNNISNIPTDKTILNNIKDTLTELDRIRELFGNPIQITSGYRSPELNALVGGEPNSAHQYGFAADIISPKTTNRELFEFLKGMCLDGALEVDQLIWEKGTKTEPKWIHISFDKSRMRKQIIYKKS